MMPGRALRCRWEGRRFDQRLSGLLRPPQCLRLTRGFRLGRWLITPRVVSSSAAPGALRGRLPAVPAIPRHPARQPRPRLPSGECVPAVTAEDARKGTLRPMQQQKHLAQRAGGQHRRPRGGSGDVFQPLSHPPLRSASQASTRALRRPSPTPPRPAAGVSFSMLTTPPPSIPPKS